MDHVNGSSAKGRKPIGMCCLHVGAVFTTGTPKSFGMNVFWTLAGTIFLDLWPYFFWTWGHMCFLDLAEMFFVDLDEFVLDLKDLFWTQRVFVFDAGF